MMRLWRFLAPTRSDAAATSLGLATPFLMAADASAPLTWQQLMLVAFATAAGGLFAKTVLASLGAAGQAVSRRWLADKNPKNDTAAIALGAASEHALRAAKTEDDRHGDPQEPQA